VTFEECLASFSSATLLKRLQLAALPKRFKKGQGAKWIDLALPCLCLRTRYDGRCLA